MYRTQAAAAVILAALASPLQRQTAGHQPRATSHEPYRVSGQSAFAYTRSIVAFGPRPSGSPAMRKLQAYLLARLQRLNCEIVEDDFTARTPAGPIAMKNILARFPGTSGRAVAVSGHYDTKLMPGIRFVGANDGGSSAGLLLELARAIAARTHSDDIYLVWFDGEEAIAQWSATDGTYGSRHLASRWASDGTAARLKALINLDMIGGRDLAIRQEFNSSPPLQRLIWRTARELGYSRHFPDESFSIEDDHVPFLRIGVNAVDLIDFEYGPGNAWWHGPEDTLDKLDPASFQIVGQTVLEVLRRLE